MQRQVKGLLYYLITENRYAIIIFWSILSLILVVSLIIGYLFVDLEGATIGFGFPFGTYFYAGIIGFTLVKESIPFALKLGAVRKNIYLAMGIFFLGFALLQALLASTLQSIIEIIVDSAGIHPFMFLHPELFIENQGWLSRVLIDTAIIFLLLTVFFMMGLLFYRGGLVVGGLFIATIGVLLILGVALGWITDFLVELYQTIDLMFFVQLFGIGLILYVITYFLIRSITTVKVR